MRETTPRARILQASLTYAWWFPVGDNHVYGPGSWSQQEGRESRAGWSKVPSLGHTHLVCDCRYNQGIWHQKGSFGFLYQGYRESRNRDLKQKHCINTLVKTSQNNTSRFPVKGKSKPVTNQQQALWDPWEVHLKEWPGRVPELLKLLLMQSQGINWDHQSRCTASWETFIFRLGTGMQNVHAC